MPISPLSLFSPSKLPELEPEGFPANEVGPTILADPQQPVGTGVFVTPPTQLPPITRLVTPPNPVPPTVYVTPPTEIGPTVLMSSRRTPQYRQNIALVRKARRAFSQRMGVSENSRDWDAPTQAMFDQLSDTLFPDILSTVGNERLIQPVVEQIYRRHQEGRTPSAQPLGFLQAALTEVKRPEPLPEEEPKPVLQQAVEEVKAKLTLQAPVPTELVQEKGELFEGKLPGRESLGKPGKKKGGAPAGERTLTGAVIARGGLDGRKLSADYDLDMVRQEGIGHVIKKGGLGLDEMAQALMSEGLLQVPEDQNPGDWLMERMRDQEKRKLPDYEGNAIIEEYEAHLKRQERAAKKPKLKDYSAKYPAASAVVSPKARRAEDNIRYEYETKLSVLDAYPSEGAARKGLIKERQELAAAEARYEEVRTKGPAAISDYDTSEEAASADRQVEFTMGFLTNHVLYYRHRIKHLEELLAGGGGLGFRAGLDAREAIRKSKTRKEAMQYMADKGYDVDMTKKFYHSSGNPHAKESDDYHDDLKIDKQHDWRWLMSELRDVREYENTAQHMREKPAAKKSQPAPKEEARKTALAEETRKTSERSALHFLEELRDEAPVGTFISAQDVARASGKPEEEVRAALDRLERAGHVFSHTQKIQFTGRKNKVQTQLRKYYAPKSWEKARMYRELRAKESSAPEPPTKESTQLDVKNRAYFKKLAERRAARKGKEVPDDSGLTHATELYAKHREDVDLLKFTAERLQEKYLGMRSSGPRPVGEPPTKSQEAWNRLTARQQGMRWTKFQDAMRKNLQHMGQTVEKLRKAGFRVEYEEGQEHYTISVPPKKQ